MGDKPSLHGMAEEEVAEEEEAEADEGEERDNLMGLGGPGTDVSATATAASGDAALRSLRHIEKPAKEGDPQEELHAAPIEHALLSSPSPSSSASSSASLFAANNSTFTTLSPSFSLSPTLSSTAASFLPPPHYLPPTSSSSATTTTNHSIRLYSSSSSPALTSVSASSDLSPSIQPQQPPQQLPHSAPPLSHSAASVTPALVAADKYPTTASRAHSTTTAPTTSFYASPSLSSQQAIPSVPLSMFPVHKANNHLTTNSTGTRAFSLSPSLAPHAPFVYTHPYHRHQPIHPYPPSPLPPAPSTSATIISPQQRLHSSVIHSSPLPSSSFSASSCSSIPSPSSSSSSSSSSTSLSSFLSSSSYETQKIENEQPLEAQRESENVSLKRRASAENAADGDSEPEDEEGEEDGREEREGNRETTREFLFRMGERIGKNKEEVMPFVLKLEAEWLLYSRQLKSLSEESLLRLGLPLGLIAEMKKCLHPTPVPPNFLKFKWEYKDKNKGGGGRKRKTLSLNEWAAKVERFAKETNHSVTPFYVPSVYQVECFCCGSAVNMNKPGQLYYLKRHVQGVQPDRPSNHSKNYQQWLKQYSQQGFRQSRFKKRRTDQNQVPMIYHISNPSYISYSSSASSSSTCPVSHDATSLTLPPSSADDFGEQANKTSENEPLTTASTPLQPNTTEANAS